LNVDLRRNISYQLYNNNCLVNPSSSRRFRIDIKLKSYKSILLKTAKALSFLFVLAAILFTNNSPAQEMNAVYAKDTKAASRDRLYKSLINNAITKNLSYPLNDSTEENWMDAFNAIELIRYRSPWTEGRIRMALEGLEKRSDYFQRSLLEMIFDNYPGVFSTEIAKLLNAIVSEKVFAISAEYLAAANPGQLPALKIKVQQRLSTINTSAIYQMLVYRLEHYGSLNKLPALKDLLHQPFFKNAVVVYSFQRKNRNHPGLAIVRDSAGNFLKGQYTDFFYVPQLARSISNLPGYISNGNTPQGIYRMDGFAVSKSNFIGPTPNIQLTMPVETNIRHFMNDSTIADSIWTEAWYKKILPAQWKNYFPVYESYYAGMAGRTEIIAHGTTINPAYYKGEPYYPLTPSLGCLCTKEIWNEENGKRTISDQAELVNAVQLAGGANGYYVVIELNDEHRPVTIEDVVPFLKK
jgi:hypothetical protein